MADIIYPSSLPTPQASTVTPAERRALSDPKRPREARALERDRRDFERVTWPAMSSAQVAAFDAWWRTTLVYGGAWFSARWPLPQGFVSAVRKFVEQPKWAYVGRGFWRTSALMEVRGQGTPLVNDLPWGEDPGGEGAWELTVSTPSSFFVDDNAVLDPVSGLPVSGVFNETNVQEEHDYASDSPPSEGIWTWLGSAGGFFDTYSIDFEITAGDDFTTFPKFGVGRADDLGTTGGSGLYHSAGQIITTDSSDVLDSVISAIGPFTLGDVITVRIFSAVLGTAAIYLNGESVAEVGGRSAHFFIRPFNESAGG